VRHHVPALRGDATVPDTDALIAAVRSGEFARDGGG
jgi:hypothetical protein